MIVFLVVLIVVTNVAFVSATWTLRGLLAEHEARQLAVALGGAVDDYLEEHNRWADTELRLFNATEALRQHGIEMT